MTNQEHEFHRELEVFRGDCEATSQFLYAYLSIHNIAKRRRDVSRFLDEYALFWNTVLAALQKSAIIALGRAFDQKSKHNLDKMLRLAQNSMPVFSKSALGRRKQSGSPQPPTWLPAYLAAIYEPNPDDFRQLRKQVSKHRRIYDAGYRDLRDRVFAHTEASGPEQIGEIFAKTNINELKRLVSFLLSLHESLWQLFMNGKKPVVRRLRYSAKPLKGIPKGPVVTTTRPHERVVVEAERVLIRAARPNQRLHPTAARRE